MKLTVSRNFFFVLIVDIILICFSFYLSHLIRFDFMIPGWAWEKFIELIPFVLIARLSCFYLFDLYRGMWRYTSLNDLFNIGKATIVSTLLIIVFVLYVNRFKGVSRSVFIIDWCLIFLSCTGLRIFIRLCFEQFSEKISFNDFVQAVLRIFKINRKQNTGVLIIGAGDLGEKICREIRDSRDGLTKQYYVIGFLDDDSTKIGRKIHGFSVLGKIEDLEPVANSTGATEIIIAITSANSERMKQIVSICKKSEVSYKTIPNMGELINGRLTVNSIRNVEYRDLLGRKPVVLDRDKIGEYLEGKTILVTGAGGSIGRELCRQICRYAPENILLFERAETPLFEIDLELKKEFKKIKIIPILGDIQDKEELDKNFKKYRPGIVFHAAAYKHVPMLEMHPWKAVQNNIVGTQNLVEMAGKHNCDKFVFVSTDKAVNPTNVMGASKRISEIIVQTNKDFFKTLKTNFITVRFGNVIGSAGSVIPLFKKQIKNGGPVTVTHPDMIRYFMLIPEACQLILQAGAMGRANEIFILEMGKPVNIDEMARDLIRFMGFKPDQDIKIEYTGLRPGEKLFEELKSECESVVSTDHKKIMVLNSRETNIEILKDEVEKLIHIAKNRNKDEIQAQIKKIIPEYTPFNQ